MVIGARFIAYVVRRGEARFLCTEVSFHARLYYEKEIETYQASVIVTCVKLKVGLGY